MHYNVSAGRRAGGRWGHGVLAWTGPSLALMTLFRRSGTEPHSSCPRWGSPSSLRTASRTCLGSVSPCPCPGPVSVLLGLRCGVGGAADPCRPQAPPPSARLAHRPRPAGGGEPRVASGAAHGGGGGRQVQARQREGEGAHEGHHGDLPDPPAVRQGGRGAGCRGGGAGGERAGQRQPAAWVLSPLRTQGTLQQFVDNFFQSVLAPEFAVPPAVKYFFDFLDEQAEKHDIKDEDTIHIWKTNRWGRRRPAPSPPAAPPLHPPPAPRAPAAPHPRLAVSQLAAAVLGEHPQEPPLHIRRARPRGGGRLPVGHRPDLHGRLHTHGAQAEPCEWPRGSSGGRRGAGSSPGGLGWAVSTGDTVAGMGLRTTV